MITVKRTNVRKIEWSYEHNQSFWTKTLFCQDWGDIPFKNSDFSPSFIWYISELYTMLYAYQLQLILFGKYDLFDKISILAVSFYKNYKTSNHNMKSGVIIFYTFVVLCTYILVFLMYILYTYNRYDTGTILFIRKKNVLVQCS